jgi:hypothetical protein
MPKKHGASMRPRRHGAGKGCEGFRSSSVLASSGMSPRSFTGLAAGNKVSVVHERAHPAPPKPRQGGRRL